MISTLSASQRLCGKKSLSRDNQSGGVIGDNQLIKGRVFDEGHHIHGARHAFPDSGE
jgi:hypothetical protein